MCKPKATGYKTFLNLGAYLNYAYYNASEDNTAIHHVHSCSKCCMLHRLLFSLHISCCNNIVNKRYNTIRYIDVFVVCFLEQVIILGNN